MADLVFGARGTDTSEARGLYRADIDGLRAISVLAVVLFHAGLRQLSGGFVGVDVFFVISGYLVGSHVLQEVDKGRFSLAGFYERRARRILPALFGMLLGVLIISILATTPSETVNVARSGLATLLFASNFFFLGQSGYFAPDSALQPLLHTWSLGVEEQFYILFPIAVWCLRKVLGPFRTRLAIAALAVISFAFSIPGGLHRDAATFYLLPTRAWELLIGTLLAERIIPAPGSAMARHVWGLAGLALILVAMFKYTSDTRFPGASALLPCVGAVLIIGAGTGGSSLVTRLLSSRLAIWLGLLSYSLYLWHWPVIVYLRRLTLPLGPLPVATSAAVVLALSLVLAWASWKFVETPVRSRLRFSVRAVCSFSAIAGVALACLFGFDLVTKGLPQRLPADARETASYLDYADTANTAMLEGQCFMTSRSSRKSYDKATCLHMVSDKPNVLLFGDSHAADLRPGLTSASSQFNLMQATASGCRPTITRDKVDERRCIELVDWVWNKFLDQHRVSRLILSARWYESDIPGLAKSLDLAKQRRIPVTVVGPAPEYYFPLPLLLYSGAQPGAPTDQAETLAKLYLDSGKVGLERKLRAAVKAHGGTYVSLLEELCSPKGCRLWTQRPRPIQFDRDHFTIEGSSIAAAALLPPASVTNAADRIGNPISTP